MEYEFNISLQQIILHPSAFYLVSVSCINSHTYEGHSIGFERGHMRNLGEGAIEKLMIWKKRVRDQFKVCQ